MPRRSQRLANKPRVNYAKMAGKKTRKTVARLAPPVKRAVTAIIKRNQETKMVSCGSFYAAPYGASTLYGVPFNSSITSSTEFYPIIPPCPQGLSEGQRLGDRIKPLGLTVRCLVSATGSYTSSQLSRCRLFVVSAKNIKDNLLQSQLQPDQLLDYGGFIQQYDGSPTGHTVPINKEGWTVYHDKRFTITKGTGKTPQLGNGYTGDQVFVPTNQSIELVFKVKLPANLTYAEDALVSPTNSAIWMALGYTQPDGATTPDNILGRITMTWISTMYYKDA